MKEQAIAHAESFQWGMDHLGLALTRIGGHMAPVHFFKDSDTPFAPYFIAPWHNDVIEPGVGDNDIEVLRKLRGDFFCMPFAHSGDLEGECYPIHGETSTCEWALESDSVVPGNMTTSFTLDSRVREGRVTKTIGLRADQDCIYISHRIDGMAGPMTAGHHPTLRGDLGPIHLHHSPIAFGRVMNLGDHPDETKSLIYDEIFNSLQAVPGRDGTPHDRSVFPPANRCLDIVALCTAGGMETACTVAQFLDQGTAWFVLKDPRVFPLTLLWMENRGRRQSPWNGRSCCIGIEDLCSHYLSPLAVSAGDNDLTAEGIPTCLQLRSDRPTHIRSIQGAVRLPPGMGRITHTDILDHEIRFSDSNGLTASASVDTGCMAVT